jgi:hypothetical protein
MYKLARIAKTIWLMIFGDVRTTMQADVDKGNLEDLNEQNERIVSFART